MKGVHHYGNRIKHFINHYGLCSILLCIRTLSKTRFKNHTGSDRETLMEGVIFGFGFMSIGFIAVGLVTALIMLRK